MQQLKKFPDISIFSREGHPGAHHKSDGAPIHTSPLEMMVPFTTSSRKDSLHSRHILRGGALNRKSRGNPGVVPPFQNTPICLSPFQKKLISLHASTVTWIIYSHHGGTCDSPLGKPRGKATDPCVNSTGSLTLLVQLRRKADMNVSTRAKD